MKRLALWLLTVKLFLAANGARRPCWLVLTGTRPEIRRVPMW